MRNSLSVYAIAVLAVLGVAMPGIAQQDQLFDSFSLALEGSWVTMNTNLRLDSKSLGVGTELDFESDGGLDSSKMVPSLSFDWQPGRHHRLTGWWQNVDRSNTAQILEEFQFGDEVYPVDELVTFSLGTEEYGLGYTYFFNRTERFAWGIGGGVRTLRMSAGLAAQNLAISSEGNFTGPLPFVWAEARTALGDRWRLIGNLGLFYVKVGDYSGTQYMLDGAVEHLTLNWLSLGIGVRGGLVNVDVDTSDYSGEAKIGVGSVRVFARLRL